MTLCWGETGSRIDQAIRERNADARRTDLDFAHANSVAACGGTLASIPNSPFLESIKT